MSKQIPGGGISGFALLRRYMTLLKFEAGRLRHATSEEDG